MYSRLLRAGMVLALMILSVPALAFAQHTSPNYEIDEVFIGGGGELNACSPNNNYCADMIAGGTSGSTSSPNYILEGGFGTPGDPAIEVVVSNNLIDLGVLNNSGTGAASANFSVSSYLSNGYIVRIHGNPPSTATGAGAYMLTPLNAPNESQPGTEQFGINLVANTTPGIGANPQQVPDDTFSNGQPAVGYDQPDYFKYVDGDVIAESDRETGRTNYTISIVANVANRTPGGRYRTTLVIQVVPTY